MDAEVINLFRTAIDSYLAEPGSSLEPSIPYLSYDFDFIHARDWYILGEQMVVDELRELTNIINRWHGDLQRWHAWNNIVRAYDENEAWKVRREFVEALVHQCLLEPSAVRDKLTFVATNAFHQVRMSYRDGYKDYLEGDPKHPGNKPDHLTRRKKEKRLRKIITMWPDSDLLLNSLASINNQEYQKATYDYRNRVNHAIGPRLGLGITQAVVRSVVPDTQMQQQADGTYRAEEVPGKLSVSYGFGGTHPIDLEEARLLNLQQFHHARECYGHYFDLLRSSVECIKKKEENA